MFTKWQSLVEVQMSVPAIGCMTAVVAIIVWMVWVSCCVLCRVVPGARLTTKTVVLASGRVASIALAPDLSRFECVIGDAMVGC